MHFDHETSIVITKINNLSEAVLTNYCQNFGKVVRCYIKSGAQSRIKEAYALIKFVDRSSVTSILSNRNHTINGTHVVMRSYHQDNSNSNNNNTNASGQPVPNLISLNQQNQNASNPGQKQLHYDQLLQENHSLKFEIQNLQKSLTEAQIYSKTAYETFQALREKFEVEQALTTRLRQEYADMVESYEAKLKQLPIKSIEKDNKIKDEPLDCDTQKLNIDNHLLEMQVMRDRLEQAQIDLGKCQTENAILKAKLTSCEQQSDQRVKDLNNQYVRMKNKYDYISSCIKDFHSKVYEKKRLKTEYDDDIKNKSSEENNDDIVEVIMQVE